MSEDELRGQIAEGVVFWGYEEGGRLLAVMGMQRVKDVTLIRHAYVRSDEQQRGIGSHLLAHLRSMTSGPVLIGTWEAAAWAIRFYERHGFTRVSQQEKDRLLRTYWNVPERQIETSVVLADRLDRRVDGLGIMAKHQRRMMCGFAFVTARRANFNADQSLSTAHTL